MKNLIKKTVLVLFSTLFMYISNCYSQETSESSIMINENTIIKDETGNKIEIFKLMELMNSGKWSMDPVNDEEGKLIYVQLRKATEEEKKMMSKIPKMSQIPNQKDSYDLIGKSVPNFKMTDINGNTISSENTKGKIVVLNF